MDNPVHNGLTFFFYGYALIQYLLEIAVLQVLVNSIATQQK